MAVQGLELEDPLGSKMQFLRVGNLAIACSIELAADEPFRMFEDDRARLAAFLREPLEG